MAGKWRVSFNTAKSKVVVLTRRRKLRPRLYISDTQLSCSPGVKYLGLHLDRRLTWWTLSGQVALKTARRPYQLRPLFCNSAMSRGLAKLVVIRVRDTVGYRRNPCIILLGSDP